MRVHEYLMQHPSNNISIEMYWNYKGHVLIAISKEWEILSLLQNSLNLPKTNIGFKIREKEGGNF